MPRTLLPQQREKASRVDSSLAIVNVVFLLIFFFLTTGSLVEAPGLDVDLSQTSRLPIDSLPKPILILQGGGAMSLNGDPIASEDLAAALLDDPILHVLIDRKAAASELLELMGREDLFATEIRLVTLHVPLEEAARP